VNKRFQAFGLPVGCLLFGLAFAQSTGQERAPTDSPKQPIVFEVSGFAVEKGGNAAARLSV